MSNKTFYMTDLEKIEVGEAPMPQMGPDDVIIKIQSVGVCGSDLHYYRTGAIGDFVVKFPFVLGHEAAGVVYDVGENVKNLKKGDRVCMEPGVPCMKCEECLTGNYNLCKDVKLASMWRIRRRSRSRFRTTCPLRRARWWSTWPSACTPATWAG